jgi:DNA replication protein DnaC
MADSLLGKLCHVCFRLHQFKSMPLLEIDKELGEIIPKRYWDAMPEHLPKTLHDALFANEIDTGVLLWGGAGVGKTYAMAALARIFFCRGFTVKRVHYETLCLQLRDTFKPRATQTEWSILEPLLKADKLFIEDLGTSKGMGGQETDFSARTFTLLLDQRMEQMLPTFITTNKAIENLGFGERVSDRLRTLQVFKLGPKSRRK